MVHDGVYASDEDVFEMSGNILAKNRTLLRRLEEEEKIEIKNGVSYTTDNLETIRVSGWSSELIHDETVIRSNQFQITNTKENKIELTTA